MTTRYAANEARNIATSVPAEASRVRAEPAFQRFARLGLGSRAAIYALLAYMAADIALTDSSPAQPSGTGAITEIGRQPGGRVLLALLAVGFAGYGSFRVSQVLGEGGPKNQAESALKRVGWAAVAIIYFGLCARAITLALGSGSGGGGGTSSKPQPVVAVVLRWPAGPVWVGLVGVVIAACGAALVVWGFAHDYSETLDRRRMSEWAFQAARATGIAGDASRGMLIVLVSVYLLAAAVTDNPAHAKGLGQALRSFARLPSGPALLLVAAAGLACFAVYSIFEALYRQV